MAIGPEIEKIEHPPRSGEFMWYVPCDWTDLKPVLPIPVWCRNPHFWKGFPDPETAIALESKRKQALAKRDNIFEQIVDTAGTREKRISTTAQFVTKCRKVLYNDLHGRLRGPEVTREKSYLRRLARNDDFVQAFFYFYKDMFLRFDPDTHWNMFKTVLHEPVHDAEGEVVELRPLDREGHPVEVDEVARSTDKGKFFWVKYRGSFFSILAEMFAFKSLETLSVSELRDAFCEGAVREEVNRFLDTLLRVRLLEAISILSPGLRFADHKSADRYLKKLFVAEAQSIDEFIDLLGARERERFARIGLFRHGRDQDVRFVRYMDTVLHDVFNLSEKWRKILRLRRASAKTKRALGRLRSLAKSITQFGIVGSEARGALGFESTKSHLIMRRFLREAFRPRIKRLVGSIIKRTKAQTKAEKNLVKSAVQEAFTNYVRAYRWGRRPLEAYVFMGFQKGGVLYHRAMDTIHKRPIAAIKELHLTDRENLAWKILALKKIKGSRSPLSRLERSIVKCWLKGSPAKQTAKDLGAKFPEITARRVYRIRAKVLDLLRLDKYWRALEQNQAAEIRKATSRRH